MPWPFQKKLTSNERALTLTFVRHFQLMMASQQLTMELYNEAIAEASDYSELGDELLVRGGGQVSSPEAVAAHILPALREKNAILTDIAATHAALANQAQGIDRVRIAYDRMSGAIDIWRSRGALQEQCWSAWTQDPSSDLGSRLASLDAAEVQANAVALDAVNALFPTANIDRAALVEINRQTFNLIRLRRGLRPLTPESYRELYTLLLAGSRPRFFVGSPAFGARPTLF
jgi:hypothetical protein